MPSVPCVITGTITWSSGDSGGGERPPVDPGFGKPSPIDPIYGVRPPIDPGYGVRPPVDPGFGRPSPIDPIYGVRPPVDPAFGRPSPIDPIYGVRPPSDPGHGKPPAWINADPEHPINKPPVQDPPPGFEWIFVFVPGVGWGWVCRPVDKADGAKP